MLAQTAYMSGRSYAFQPFINKYDTNDLVVPRGEGWQTARIPLNALLGGPIAGGQWPQEPGKPPNKAPRSVSWDYFYKICPEERRVKINVTEFVKQAHLDLEDAPSGKETIDKWSQKLGATDETCVEVAYDYVFTFWYASVNL
jgi:hypothetical protein